jgi:hypothetical protein
VGRKHKLGLTVFSILLWVQLVFSIGITAWRYWLVSTGEAELFVSASMERIEPLLAEIRDQCSSAAALFYIGDGPSYDYYRYQFFPRRVALVRPGEEDSDFEQLAIRVDQSIQALGGDACLLFEQLPPESFYPGERIVIDGELALYIIRK